MSRLDYIDFHTSTKAELMGELDTLSIGRSEYSANNAMQATSLETLDGLQGEMLSLTTLNRLHRLTCPLNLHCSK